MLECQRGDTPLKTILLGVCVFLLDLWTKWLVMTRLVAWEQVDLIPGVFALQFVYNPGAAFGMLAHQQWLFISVSVFAVGAILYLMRRPEYQVSPLPVALGLLLGGAVGNLVDRVRYGQVVDFLLLYWQDWRFPNFNVADIGITVGVGLFILHLMLTGEESKREDL